MSSPQKPQTSEPNQEPQSPSQIFKIESEAQNTPAFRADNQQNGNSQGSNQISSGDQESGQIDQPGSPSAALTAKKQNSLQGNGEYNVGRWSNEEHNLFLEALRLYGKNWDKIQKHVRTRSVVNIRSHSQKFNFKLEKLVDKEGTLLAGVDWDKQVLAGVDEHGSAPYYFKLLMKRTKKDALKNAQNKMTPTNDTSSRPRFESNYNESNLSAPGNQNAIGSSGDSQEGEQDMNKSQKSQEKGKPQQQEEMLDMEFPDQGENGIVNFSSTKIQNQTDQAPQNSNQGNRILHDDSTRQQLNQQIGMNLAGDSEMIKVVDRNSFREHYKNKMNEVLSIDNRTKMTDAEIANYNDYFFDQLEQRDAGKSHPKKESFKTNMDFVSANLKHNGLHSLDERLKGSRFNFQQSQDIKQEFLKYQQLEQMDFCNQMNIEIGAVEQNHPAMQSHVNGNIQNNIMDFTTTTQSKTDPQPQNDYMNYNQTGAPQQTAPNNNLVDAFMGAQAPTVAADNNVAMDVADDVTMIM